MDFIPARVRELSGRGGLFIITIITIYHYYYYYYYYYYYFNAPVFKEGLNISALRAW